MDDGILAKADPATSRVLEALAPVLRDHAPVPVSAVRDTRIASLDPGLELHADLGFDVIALAELAVAIEDEFGIDTDTADLAACRTVRSLGQLIANRIYRRTL